MNILNKYSPDISDINKRIKKLNDLKINVINSKISSGEYDNQILEIISNHSYLSLLIMIDLESFTKNDVKNYNLTQERLNIIKQYFIENYNQILYDVVIEDSKNYFYPLRLLNVGSDKSLSYIDLFNYDEYHDLFYVNKLYKENIINRFNYVFINRKKEISNILEMRYNMIINENNEENLKY